MKKEYFVLAVLCFALAGFCYWMTYTQVMPRSDKDILNICRWGSIVMGTFSMGLSLAPLWERR